MLQDVIEDLRGPGLVLIDPPYEPYNEYLTWNLYTIRTFLGFELRETKAERFDFSDRVRHEAPRGVARGFHRHVVSLYRSSAET